MWMGVWFTIEVPDASSPRLSFSYYPSPYRNKIHIFRALLNPTRADKSRQPARSSAVKIAA